MTDVLKTPEKKRIRQALIAGAIDALARDGWKVSRDKGGLRGRVRRITKDRKTLLAAIRTSQDGWIAFPRNATDSRWVTLEDVDVVVAAAINPERPEVGLVHLFDSKELRERFDRAYAARRAEGHQISIGRGLWVSLYHPESKDPVYYVGAGLGLLRKAFASIPLEEDDTVALPTEVPLAVPPNLNVADAEDGSEPLTIAQAKRRLARTLGVPESSVRISIEA